MQNKHFKQQSAHFHAHAAHITEVHPNEKCLAHNQLVADKAPIAAVFTVIAVVAHHEIMAFGHVATKPRAVFCIFAIAAKRKFGAHTLRQKARLLGHFQNVETVVVNGFTISFCGNGDLAGIGGAFLGGVCVAAFGFRRMLLVAALGVALSNLAFLLMAQYPSQIWAFYAAITADNVAQGFAGTTLVAFMSSLTDRNFTATQFALMVSLANLPGKFAGGLSGYLVEASSYATFFTLSAMTVVPTLLLLAWLWPRIREAAPAPASG